MAIIPSRLSQSTSQVVYALCLNAYLLQQLAICSGIIFGDQYLKESSALSVWMRPKAPWFPTGVRSRAHTVTQLLKNSHHSCLSFSAEEGLRGYEFLCRASFWINSIAHLWRTRVSSAGRLIPCAGALLPKLSRRFGRRDGSMYVQRSVVMNATWPKRLRWALLDLNVLHCPNHVPGSLIKLTFFFKFSPWKCPSMRPPAFYGLHLCAMCPSLWMECEHDMTFLVLEGTGCGKHHFEDGLLRSQNWVPLSDYESDLGFLPDYHHWKPIHCAHGSTGSWPSILTAIMRQFM